MSEKSPICQHSRRVVFCSFFLKTKSPGFRDLKGCFGIYLGRPACACFDDVVASTLSIARVNSLVESGLRMGASFEGMLLQIVGLEGARS